MTPRGLADLERMIDTYRELDDCGKILLGMGPWGFPTRVLAGKLGSAVSFCSSEGGAAAPGHVGPAEMAGTYRFKDVGRGTRVFCVLGNPVMHSRSPWIHNPALESLGLDAVYVPVQVDEVPTFFRLAPRLDIDGASVTIPHKEAVIPFLSSVDPAVSATGSCNTIVRDGGAWTGTNTDAPGFLASLRDLAPPERLRGARVTVVGAGGTARSAAYALVRSGAKVLVVNRTAARAEALAAELGCDGAPLGPASTPLIRAHGDLIVQTTGVGMLPDLSGDPLCFYEFSGRETVYDVVYTPPETTLLRRARAAGCRVLNGAGMLLEQAFLQFELFTGRRYPDGLKNEVAAGLSASRSE